MVIGRAVIKCPVGFLLKRNIEVTFLSVFFLVHTAPVFFVPYLTELESDFLGCADTLTAVIQTETNIIITVRGLYLPHNGILTVISVNKAFPDRILYILLAGTAELCGIPVVMGVINFKVLCLLVIFQIGFQPGAFAVLRCHRIGGTVIGSKRLLIMIGRRTGIIITEIDIVVVASGQYPILFFCIGQRGCGGIIIGIGCYCRSGGSILQTGMIGGCAVDSNGGCFGRRNNRLIESISRRRERILIVQIKYSTGQPFSVGICFQDGDTLTVDNRHCCSCIIVSNDRGIVLDFLFFGGIGIVMVNQFFPCYGIRQNLSGCLIILIGHTGQMLNDIYPCSRILPFMVILRHAEPAVGIGIRNYRRITIDHGFRLTVDFIFLSVRL